jgi:hypothetical protein
MDLSREVHCDGSRDWRNRTLSPLQVCTTIRISIGVAFILYLVLTLVTQFLPRSSIVTRLSGVPSFQSRARILEYQCQAGREGRRNGGGRDTLPVARYWELSELVLLSSSLFVNGVLPPAIGNHSEQTGGEMVGVKGGKGGREVGW